MKSTAKDKKKQITGFRKQGYFRFWRGFRDDPLWKEKRIYSQFEA